jgi:undecaprenyl pyrophosphate phosphatase UppP
MLFGLSRKAATEFSFFLAVPTLVAPAPTTCTGSVRRSRGDRISRSGSSRRSFRRSSACGG